MVKENCKGKKRRRQNMSLFIITAVIFIGVALIYGIFLNKIMEKNEAKEIELEELEREQKEKEIKEF